MIDQLVPGQAIFTRTPAGVVLTHADPVLWVSRSFLNEIRDGSDYATVDGDLLTLTCTNRTMIYRIGEYNSARHAYLCSWPD